MSYVFFFISQLSAEDGCNELSPLERKLLDVMNDICDLLGSVRVDEWLSFPGSLAGNIQRLLLQRSLVSLFKGRLIFKRFYRVIFYNTIVIMTENDGFRHVK